MILNQVTLPSIDVNRGTEFYQKLGLKLIVDSRPRYVRFELPDGDATLSLHVVDKLPSGEGISVYFQQEDLDHHIEFLQSKGLQFDLLPTDQPWLWREARLKDPDGNQLIIYSAGENRKNPHLGEFSFCSLAQIVSLAYCLSDQTRIRHQRVLDVSI